MGVSFREYLNDMRIQAAKKLLVDRDLKIGQIAEMVGFGDATYFATAFKGITGKNPKDFRKTLTV
jgi:YesN/AraC family two-component response regulator